ncbi:MAG: class I SAM-dependent methyltransferase [Pseudoflavonifractor sp.]|nr:class I SAM-dependent methyltransferase [Alloprevotella sp.]MCM1117088.1 class I SAM-dependent methyltransferase [Pseudoflavonifractor sp.]
MGKGFDRYAGEYDAWFIANPNVLASEARLVAATLRNGGRILSVGCGSGLFEKILRDDYGIDVAYGVEPSEAMADIARKRGLDVSIATAEDYDYPADHFDTILFNGCPSYISDLDRVLAKVYDALAPGGKVVLIDVPKESSYGIMYNLAKALGKWDDELLHGVFPPNPYPIEFVNEAHWRTTAEKAEALRRAGFHDLSYLQTLTRHPLYSDQAAEEPSEGHDRGDYVAVTAYKR